MNLYSANIVLDLRSVAIYEGKLYHFLLLDVFSWPVLLDFSLTLKAATLIFISGCGSAIPNAKEGKSGFIYNLVKS